jgi:hypothetical protein
VGGAIYTPTAANKEVEIEKKQRRKRVQKRRKEKKRREKGKEATINGCPEAVLAMGCLFAFGFGLWTIRISLVFWYFGVLLFLRLQPSFAVFISCRRNTVKPRSSSEYSPSIPRVFPDYSPITP